MSGEADSETAEDDGELKFGRSKNDLATPVDEGAEEDSAGVQETEPGSQDTTPGEEPSIRGSADPDAGRESSDPLSELPDDLNRENLSSTGAREFLALDPEELYSATIEPYKFNRNKAHDQRKQDGLFLREPVLHGVDSVHTALSHLYAEDQFHRADTLELMMAVALRHADEIPEVAADLGFGLDMNTYMQTRFE